VWNLGPDAMRSMRTSTPGLADDVARDSRGAAVRAERPQQAHAGVHPEQMDDMRLLPENDGEVGAPQPGRPWTYEGGHGTVGKSWAGWAGSRERDYKTNRHAGGGVRMGEGTWPVFRLGRLHPQQPGRARTRWLPRNHRTTRLTRKTTFSRGRWTHAGVVWGRRRAEYVSEAPGASRGAQWEQRLWSRCWASPETSAAVRAARQDITDLSYRMALRVMR
jgi:hypothetical protein